MFSLFKLCVVKKYATILFRHHSILEISLFDFSWREETPYVVFFRVLKVSTTGMMAKLTNKD
jgi:hypothetical protein